MEETTFVKNEKILNQKTLQNIDIAFNSPYKDWSKEIKTTIEITLAHLDQGNVRVSTPTTNGWQHQPYLQKAILSYFKTQNIVANQNPFLFYQDKIPSKFVNNKNTSQCRIVPPTHVRYGAYIGDNCVLMPCFVNIGAYVDNGTMLDTWCAVGAGAQIGKNCHISGGAGIGGVLEPPQATPTIIEDNCFIGARSEIAEGVIVQKGAVLAMGTFVSQSTKIYHRDTGKITFGTIPENAVVVPGSIPSQDQTHSTYAVIIVKYCDEKTRKKTSINQLLREL
ncbi:MAG: 2,3,4,5-tetrahydropyridine-2,6-dicarboxylate N-succinyltransferase [Pseudomonadota bacterium]|nr:2,3,4,5-tetrahydropyridine-2,6-dicarboxylate N-succinyltransferase [Pseudomonadota bacterium]